MKSFLISDNRDTYLGMRLAGIEAVYLKYGEGALNAFKNALNNGYGIIFLTEKIYIKIKDEVIKIKKTRKLPLITVIPDRHGYGEDREKITDYIKESIGL